MLDKKLAMSIFMFSLATAAVGQEVKTSVVHVSGEGRVRIAPDHVIIELTATTTDDDLIRVRARSDEDARAILTIANGHGVENEAFEVDRLELSLDYNSQLKRQIYEVERDVTLTLGDLAKLDPILSELLDEENLRVNGIRFVSSRLKENQREALTLAIKDAKDKAQHLAELTDQKLGRTLEINILSESQRPFVTSIVPAVGSGRPSSLRDETRHLAGKETEGHGFVSLQVAKDHAVSADAEANAEPFALGMIEVTAEVDMTYELTQ